MRQPANSRIPVEKAEIYPSPFSEGQNILVDQYKSPGVSTERYNLHEPWEMGVVLAGLYRIIWNQIEFTLKPGEMWWCGPWELHGWANEKPGTTVIVISFKPGVIYSLPTDDPFASSAYLPFLRPEIRPRLQPKNQAERQHLIRQALALHELASSAPLYQQTALRLAFLQLLLHVMQRYPQAKNISFIQNHTVAERVVTTVNFIRQNLAERINLEDAARQACLSRTHFARSFRQVMGTTFGQYVLKARLEKAHQEIQKGEKKLSTVALDCGFSDFSNFIVQYREQYGHTPGEEKKGARAA